MPILTYLLRRLAILVLSLFIAAVILFVLLRLLPGDPANALLGVGATEAQIAAARAQVGSDQPLVVQFLAFIGNLARFDLGQSFVSKAGVLAEIGNRMSVTAPLTLLGFVRNGAMVAYSRADRVTATGAQPGEAPLKKEA